MSSTDDPGQGASSGVLPRVLLVALGALVIVVGLGVVALMRSNATPDPSPGPTPSPAPSTVQETLLVQILDAEGYALGNVVVGTQPPGRVPLVTFMRVPASLLIPVGDDSVTLGIAPGLPDTLAATHGLSAELALRIDAGLTLDRLAFAGLVDAAGGITIDVPRAVTLPASDGTVKIVGPGLVTMDGVTAADYATARIPGEGEEARIERAASVLDLALEGLPGDADQMRQVLTSLGSLAKPTVPTEQLVPFFLTVRSDMRFGRTTYAVLPVDVIRVGLRPASVPSADAEALVQRLFPDARITPAM